MDFGLKLPDLYRSELFRPFMPSFILNLSFFTLIWFFSNLVYRSPLCFGFIHATSLMLLARSDATSWTLLAACSAIAWVLLSRSGAYLEPLCQDPSSAVPGRPYSRTSFFIIFCKKMSLFAFGPALSGLCVRIWMLMVENYVVKYWFDLIIQKLD